MALCILTSSSRTSAFGLFFPIKKCYHRPISCVSVVVGVRQQTHLPKQFGMEWDLIVLLGHTAICILKCGTEPKRRRRPTSTSNPTKWMTDPLKVKSSTSFDATRRRHLYSLKWYRGSLRTLLPSLALVVVSARCICQPQLVTYEKCSKSRMSHVGFRSAWLNKPSAARWWRLLLAQS